MSVLGKLNSNDFIKGLVVAVITATLTTFMNLLDSPEFSFTAIDWNSVARVAVTAGIGYLIKNFATDDQGKILGIGKSV